MLCCCSHQIEVSCISSKPRREMIVGLFQRYAKKTQWHRDHTLLRFHMGEAGWSSAWSSCCSLGRAGLGSNTSRDLIMNSSAKTVPKAAAPDRASTCASGMAFQGLEDATGSAMSSDPSQTACIPDAAQRTRQYFCFTCGPLHSSMLPFHMNKAAAFCTACNVQFQQARHPPFQRVLSAVINDLWPGSDCLQVYPAWW